MEQKNIEKEIAQIAGRHENVAKLLLAIDHRNKVNSSWTPINNGLTAIKEIDCHTPFEMVESIVEEWDKIPQNIKEELTIPLTKWLEYVHKLPLTPDESRVVRDFIYVMY